MAEPERGHKSEHHRATINEKSDFEKKLASPILRHSYFVLKMSWKIAY
jgi:hypothetical protein